MNTSQIIHSPELWPQYPYLRVERRKESRPGQATCFVKVTGRQEVEPKVMATHNWPPSDTDEIELVFEFDYGDWDALFSEGWRPILPAWMERS